MYVYMYDARYQELLDEYDSENNFQSLAQHYLISPVKHFLRSVTC